MRFKIGQKIVCTKKDIWIDRGYPTSGPKFNEVVTVLRYNPKYQWGVILHEYPDDFYCGFDEKWFEPLMTDDQLYILMQSIKETLEV